MLASITDETLSDTKRYRDFKAAGTKGIAECQIRSIILPLLADHVLREANHYISSIGRSALAKRLGALPIAHKNQVEKAVSKRKSILKRL